MEEDEIQHLLLKNDFGTTKIIVGSPEYILTHRESLHVSIYSGVPTPILVGFTVHIGLL